MDDVIKVRLIPALQFLIQQGVVPSKNPTVVARLELSLIVAVSAMLSLQWIVGL
jgi:hypothetical protein